MGPDKKEIRKKIIKERDLVDFELKRKMDKSILERFINSDYYKNSSVIFAFVSFGSEVDTKELIKQAISDKKTVCVPRVISREEGFEICKIEGLHDLEEGFYGILEPRDNCRIINGDCIDFILMPGVAFDRHGGRIGYGGGFYDRYLGGLGRGIPKIALAYDLQIINEIPMDHHDIPVDGIITENEFIGF